MDPILQIDIDLYSLTPNVKNECGDGACEGEDDEYPAGGGVAADEVASPVLHVAVHRRLAQQLLLRRLVVPERSNSTDSRNCPKNHEWTHKDS